MQFFGHAIVAFIDILGFSKHLQEHWGDRSDSALSKLLRIKQAVPTDANSVTLGLYHDHPGDGITYLCRIGTLSDSIVISVALPAKPRVQDLLLPFAVVYGNIGTVWRR
jgi:hypothetical protein